MIRLRDLTSAMLVAGGVFAFAFPSAPAQAAEGPSGIWLTSDYPAVTERIGEDATLNLDLINARQPPARVALSVQGLPKGWSAEISGGGKPVSAAMVAPGQDRNLRLKVTAPKTVAPGTYEFVVRGDVAGGAPLKLPVAMTFSAGEPDRITLTPKLPSLRGTPRSNFDFNVEVKNDGTEDTVLNLVAETQPGFSASFSEQFGNQDLTSMPFKAGESKTLKVSVKAPQDAAAGRYPVTVEASNAKMQGKAELSLEVTGQPALVLAGENGRLSGNAEAGKERTFTFNVGNTGSAIAREVNVTANAPEGWKVEAEPKTVSEIAPNGHQAVAIHITPSTKAIAGDYMVSLRAAGSGVSDSQQFRVTVTTSTVWGAVGLGIIAAAAVVLALAVARYGRR